jgi:hypothetical protein
MISKFVGIWTDTTTRNDFKTSIMGNLDEQDYLSA